LSMGGGLITAYCSGPVVRAFFLLLGPSGNVKVDLDSAKMSTRGSLAQ
jgi:hypothetical protein